MTHSNDTKDRADDGRMKVLARLLAVTAVSGALAACGGSDGDSASATPTPSPSPAPTTTAKIKGVVTNHSTGAVIAGATVTVGSLSATTNASGEYELSNVPYAERTVVRANASGYNETFAVETTAANTTRTANLRLQPVAGTTQGTGSSALTATVAGSTASVIIPANSVVDANGNAVTGSYSVALTPVQPAQDVTTMPGWYRVDRGNGTVGQMESWGALNVNLTDATGQRLNLGSGKTATIRIPVSTRSADVPSTIPLFYFNEETGLWVQEGTAALQGSGNNRYYEGRVSHFSYWNADRLYDTVYVNGCVQHANADGTPGARAAGAQVYSDGQDYSGSSMVYTNSNGNFRLPIKSNGKAVVTGLLGGQVSSSVLAGPSASEITLSSCLVLGAGNNGAISARLSWGQYPDDVDSHLYAPDGTHIYYSSKGSLTSAPFANLDVDDTTSYGPEVITILKPMVGTYTYALSNYNRDFSTGMTRSPISVQLTLPDGRVRSFTPPAGEVLSGNATNWLKLFELKVDERCNVTINPVNTWLRVSSNNDIGSSNLPTRVARTYCTP